MIIYMLVYTNEHDFVSLYMHTYIYAYTHAYIRTYVRMYVSYNTRLIIFVPYPPRANRRGWGEREGGGERDVFMYVCIYAS